MDEREHEILNRRKKYAKVATFKNHDKTAMAS